MNPALFLILSSFFACDTIRALVIERYPIAYEPEGAERSATSPEKMSLWPAGFPKFTGDDTHRKKVKTTLTPVLKGLKQPTDLIFFPGSNTTGFALQKGGELALFDLETSHHQPVTKLDVLTKSEQGLLGIALHPSFTETGQFFLHASVDQSGDEVSEITAWIAAEDRKTARLDRTILTVPQPYANHNAGQIAFGPDGMFYIGFGDGGWRNDPHDHGQNGRTLLGSILRIDVDSSKQGENYGIPTDNPWIGDESIADEAWAIGLRNPWKFSFTADGTMIVADVGQNAFEEINRVSSGDNLGWNIREARHCFPPKSKCNNTNLVDPFFEYPHTMGSSVTGGFIHSSTAIPDITGDYVFADFVSGRMWAVPVPESNPTELVKAKALGQWPFLPSTFAQDEDGRLYVADYGKGTVYRLDPQP